ncbi:hypothetical protein [Leptospira santarosai]|uniref:hypothetical protein n=1 Tax=Leptospira santarosai TaxID=28183 RepID=UPI0039AEA4B1
MGNFFCLYQSFRRRRFYRTCSKSNLSLAFYGSLVFASQRAFDYAPRLLAISLTPMYLVSSPSAILLHKTILS